MFVYRTLKATYSSASSWKDSSDLRRWDSIHCIFLQVFRCLTSFIVLTTLQRYIPTRRIYWFWYGFGVIQWLGVLMWWGYGFWHCSSDMTHTYLYTFWKSAPWTMYDMHQEKILLPDENVGILWAWYAPICAFQIQWYTTNLHNILKPILAR